MSDLRLLDPTVQIICSASLIIFDSPQASPHKTPPLFKELNATSFSSVFLYWNYIGKCIGSALSNSPQAFVKIELFFFFPFAF